MFNDSFIKVNNLYGLNESLKQIHYPKNIEKLNQAIYRLKFDEHFSLQIIMALIKKNIKNDPAASFFVNFDLGGFLK